MNFFEHQEFARTQTRRMLWLFALAVLVIVMVTDLIVMVAFGGSPANPKAWAMASAVVLLGIALASLFRIASLRSGGAAVAQQLGARPVPADTQEFAYRRLRNVVEELAIAAGVPMPEVYVLEEEAGINAFAAGYAPTDAAIAVTRGALDKLTREELQGVIGHEFSHVLNGDMRLNIRLMGLVFGILVLSIVGRKIMSGSSRSRDGSKGVMFGLALFVVGYLGVVCARLIKASVSRQREYLADASAVQFTRQTEGIAGALKKIGGLAEGSKLEATEKEEVAHMLFGDGVGYSFLFATHPPLERRIRRLDPGFDPSEMARIGAAWAQPQRVDDSLREAEGVSISGLAPAGVIDASRESRHGRLPAAHAMLRVSPNVVVEQVGNPGNDDRLTARALRRSIAPELRALAAANDQAIPLLFALVLGEDAKARARQLEAIERHYDSATRARVEAVFAQTVELHPMQRLPLAALAFPALRRRPRGALNAFMATLRALVDVDGEVDLREYCLTALLRFQVIDALDPSNARFGGRETLPSLAAELRDVLAVLARYGNPDAEMARRAYLLGMNEALPNDVTPYLPPTDWIRALERGLPKLDRLAPAGKALVVYALTRAIGADGTVSVTEAELLRTVCAGLHCPLPPLLEAAA